MKQQILERNCQYAECNKLLQPTDWKQKYCNETCRLANRNKEKLIIIMFLKIAKNYKQKKKFLYKKYNHK